MNAIAYVVLGLSLLFSFAAFSSMQRLRFEFSLQQRLSHAAINLTHPRTSESLTLETPLVRVHARDAQGQITHTRVVPFYPQEFGTDPYDPNVPTEKDAAAICARLGPDHVLETLDRRISCREVTDRAWVKRWFEQEFLPAGNATTLLETFSRARPLAPWRIGLDGEDPRRKTFPFDLFREGYAHARQPPRYARYYYKATRELAELESWGAPGEMVLPLTAVFARVDRKWRRVGSVRRKCVSHAGHDDGYVWDCKATLEIELAIALGYKLVDRGDMLPRAYMRTVGWDHFALATSGSWLAIVPFEHVIDFSEALYRESSVEVKVGFYEQHATMDYDNYNEDCVQYTIRMSR